MLCMIRLILIWRIIHSRYSFPLQTEKAGIYIFYLVLRILLFIERLSLIASLLLGVQVILFLQDSLDLSDFIELEKVIDCFIHLSWCLFRFQGLTDRWLQSSDTSLLIIDGCGLFLMDAVEIVLWRALRKRTLYAIQLFFWKLLDWIG